MQSEFKIGTCIFDHDKHVENKYIVMFTIKKGFMIEIHLCKIKTMLLRHYTF